MACHMTSQHVNEHSLVDNTEVAHCQKGQYLVYVFGFSPISRVRLRLVNER